jgi:hypothetical protein
MTQPIVPFMTWIAEKSDFKIEEISLFKFIVYNLYYPPNVVLRINPGQGRRLTLSVYITSAKSRRAFVLINSTHFLITRKISGLLQVRGVLSIEDDWRKNLTQLKLL